MTSSDAVRPALLTGATGTVGAALLDRLLADGRRVRCLVRDAASLPEHPNVEAITGSIDDAAVVDRAVRGCATIFHAAGKPQQWTADPSSFTGANVTGTRLLLDAAMREGVERFVHAGTQDTLDQELDPFDEGTVNRDPHPTPYERSKIEAQRLVDAAAVQGLNTCSLHLVAVFGASARGVRTLGALIHGLARGRVPMLPPGGLPVVYDLDAADAFVRAEAMAAPGSHYLVSDRYVTTLELARHVGRITGARVPPTMPPLVAQLMAGAGDLVAALTRRPPRLSRVSLRAFTHSGKPSNARIRAELGWTPTPLAVALEAMLAGNVTHVPAPRTP